MRLPTSARTWLIFSLLLAPLALAQDTAFLKQLENELAEQRQNNQQQVGRLESLRAQVNKLNTQQRQTFNKLEALSQKIAIRENSLAKLNARASIAESQLNDIIARHDLTKAKVVELKMSVRKLLDATYRERGSQYLRLITQSASFSDLLIRLEYANMSGEQTVQVIDLLRTESLLLKQQRNERQQRSVTFHDLQKQRLAELNKLKKQRQQQQEYLAKLRKTTQGKRALALQTRQQQGQTASKINALVSQVIQERDKIAAERQRQAKAEAARRAAEAKRLAEEKAQAKAAAERLAKQKELAARRAAEQQATLKAEQARLQAEAEARAREIEQQAAAEQQAARRAEEARLARQQAEARARAERQRQQQERTAQQQKEQQAALEARQQAVANTEARLSQQQNNAQATNQTLDPDSQNLLLPLANGQVAEPYGEGGSQWVVLSSPQGNSAQAFAALTGDVVAATFYATLGWVVLLDNGKDVVTGYFGLQELNVRVGDRVQQGQALGNIGGSYIFGADRMAFQIRRAEQPVAPIF